MKTPKARLYHLLITCLEIDPKIDINNFLNNNKLPLNFFTLSGGIPLNILNSISRISKPLEAWISLGKEQNKMPSVSLFQKRLLKIKLGIIK